MPGVHVDPLVVIPKDLRMDYMQLTARRVTSNTSKGNDSKDGMLGLQGFPKWPQWEDTSDFQKVQAKNRSL